MALHTTDDGCRLSFSLVGAESAPAVVLSNSLGTDRGLWGAQVRALAERCRVLLYDTRGHGASDAPAGDYTIDRLGRDVLSLMDHVGMARAHVCGVSIGGLTALWLGIHAPHRVDRLVLANTAARVGSAAFWNDRIRLVRDEGLDVVADATMARWFSERFHVVQPDLVAQMRSTLLHTPRAGYLGCCGALRDADLSNLAASVQAPTLVVTGAADVATPPSAGEWLAAAIPGAERVEFNAAHLANVECASEFTTALLAFLAGTAAAPGGTYA